MNFKTQLQEIFQAAGLPIPEYTTSKVGGLAHNPKFLSTVTVVSSSVDNPKISKTTAEDHNSITTVTSNLLKHSFRGSTARSKKLAEQSAASCALEHKNMFVKIDCNDGIIGLKPSVILIDLENQVPLARQLAQYKWKNVDLFGFTSTSHPILNEDLGCITVIEVNSNKSDAADTVMTMMVGSFLNENHYRTYVISTEDHFGDNIVDIVNSNLFKCKPKPSAELILDINSIISYIKEK